MSDASCVCWKKARPELQALTGETPPHSGRKPWAEDTATNILPSGNSVLTQLTLCLRTAQVTDVFYFLLTRKAPKRKDSLIIPSPFSTTKENAIYLNEEEVFNHTRQLQDGRSRNWYTQLSNVECVCIKQKPISWISHTCQAKYLVLTHGVFDIYLQSWGDLQFTSAITMYDSSAVSTGLKYKSDWNHHLFYRCLLTRYLMCQVCFALHSWRIFLGFLFYTKVESTSP